MINRAMNKQQQQQQQQQIRASKTMPQLNYTQADIQEQYLATTRVRHETRALAEQQQQQASKRSATAAGGIPQSNSELRQSVKLKRSQQLAKFDDGGQSRHGSGGSGGGDGSSQQQSPLRGDSPPAENLRDSRQPRGSNLDSKRKRSHSASRLLSACFSIPSQLANTIQNHHHHQQTGGSPSSSSSKSRASSILSHFKLGGANQYKNRRMTSGDEYQDQHQEDPTRPQMRPLSNSRTVGNMQHLHHQNASQENNQPDTDSLDSNQPGGSRMKHVSFGGGAGGHQNYKQPPARQVDAARPTTQINVINKPQTHQATAAAGATTTTAICRQPTSGKPTGISQVLPPPPSRNQTAPPRPPTLGAGGTNPPQLSQQGPIYKRLPNVPMRTQATQTEITAYHLMASPAASSAPTPSRMGGAALPPQQSTRSGHQLDTPSQRSTPTSSSTLATTELVSSSAGRAEQSAAATTGTSRDREQLDRFDREPGADADQDGDEEDELERADGGLNASLLESSSSNGSSTHSLVGHDSALADTLQCDLKIGSQPAGQLPAALGPIPTSASASSSGPETSITKKTEFEAPNPTQQERNDEILHPIGVASARGANMHELGVASNPIVGGGGGEQRAADGRTEIEPPNRFKDSEQRSQLADGSSDDDEEEEVEPPSLVSEASSQTDASLMANAHILDRIDRVLASEGQQQQPPPSASSADNAPISLPPPPSMAREVTATTNTGRVDADDDHHDDDDATPRPTPSRERAGGSGSCAHQPEGPRRQLCERRLNDSDETSAAGAMSTFDIGSTVPPELADDDQRGRHTQPAQQPTPAELRRDDFLALRAAGGEEEQGRGNEYGDELASQSSLQTTTSSTTIEPANAAAGAAAAGSGAALLSATLEDVEPISLSSAAVSPTASVSTDDGDGPASSSLQAQLSTGRDDDELEADATDDDGRLVAQRLELIEDQRQFQIAVSRAPFEDVGGSRVRPRQSSTSTLSTRHHSYCSTSAAVATGADFSNSPPSRSSSSPPPPPADFYNRRLDSDSDSDPDGDNHAAYRDPAAPAINDKDQPAEQVADRGSSSSSSSTSSSSRRTLKSRRESETGAPACRDEAERGREEEETNGGAKLVSLSSSSSSSPASQATNGRDKSETGRRDEQLPAANDPNASSSSPPPATEGQDRSGQDRPLVDDGDEQQPITQDALQQANNGKLAGGPVESAAAEPSNREEEERERAAQIESEPPARRTSSPPSPPTTVSDLDASEELSTASFVDNYKRSLKAQVGELADSFASGLIGECLTAAAATAAASNRPSGSMEARKQEREEETRLSCSSVTSSSSSASSSSATTTTSIGGASYVCLASGEIKRSEQTSSGQQQAPVARPLVPRKPAHLLAAAAAAPAAGPSQSSGAGNSQFESIRGSRVSDSDGQKRADSSGNSREQERAAAVAVAATSIAAALHQSSQQQQQFEAAARQATATPAAADEETKASGQQNRPEVEVDEVESGATHSQPKESHGDVPTKHIDKTQAPIDDDDLLGQPQSLIELSTVSEASNESLAGELSGGLISSSSQRQQTEASSAEPEPAEQQQSATGEEKRERFFKHRSESLERAAVGSTGTGSSTPTSASSAKVSQAPVKRRRSSSGERGPAQPGQVVVAKVANYPAVPLCGSSARSSPVDCPYPHDIIQALPSPPVSFSHSTSTTSAATPLTASTTLASVCPQGEKLPAIGPDEGESRARSSSTSSTCSAVASSAAAANSIPPAAQLCKRLSHDDTMEAIEDDVEGEEQEMRLEQQEEEALRSCSQTPEPSLAPPAGFTGGSESTASCFSTQLTRRPSSSLGGQSIKEEEEEEEEDEVEGDEDFREGLEMSSMPREDEAEENDEDEESSISVSQNRGVVVTQEVQRRSRPTQQKSTETAGSDIQMKRFKKSSSNSSASSSSSTAAHATPVSSPTSTPSKSSASSSNATKTADPSDKSQCEPLVDEDDDAAGRELVSPVDATCDETPPPPVQVEQTPVHEDPPPVGQTASDGETKIARETSLDTVERPENNEEKENETKIPNEFATHAILEHLSRRNPSLAAVSQLVDEPQQSLELCRSIDPQQRRASWRRESETSRLGSSTSSAATVATSAAATPQQPEQVVQQLQQTDRDEAQVAADQFAPTSTMKRRHKSQPTKTTSCDTSEPLAVETIPMQIDDSHRAQLASSEKMEIKQQPPVTTTTSGRVCDETAGSAAQEQRQESPPHAGSKRRPPLKQLKSPNQQPQQSLNSFDRTDADASICSSCSCMEASFDQSAPVPTAGAQQTAPNKQQAAVLLQQHRPGQPPAATTSAGPNETKPGPSSAWMSQEEGTVFTENYWLSHWLYISEHEEAEIWRRAIDMTSSGAGGGGAHSATGSGQIQRQVAEAEPHESATKIAGMPACMSETASTVSERSFNSRYKSTTRKMIHRRASIEMYKRIMSNSLRREKRIEISRSSVGEFGFRIHGSRPVVVSAIERGTSAETCGLQVGDVIYAINDTNILDMAHSDVVRLAHQADASSALVLDLIPTNSFLQQHQPPVVVSPGQQTSKRYEPTVTGHLMRLSASTAQPLLVQLQEQIAAEGGLANAKERALKLNKVMRRAWRARYFVLRADNCLYWYKSARDTIEPHGGLNLQGFSATLTDEFSEPTYVIRLVKYGGQPHYLGSNNLCDVQTWVDAINRAATEANQCDPYMKRTLVLARSKPNDIQEPDCSGWLYKFSHKRGGGAHWRAAYFVLKDACLYLFRSQRAELVDQASAVYYLHGYRVRSKHIEHKRHTFELVPPNRKTIKPMFLMASNEIDKKRWIAALEYSIERWIEIN